MKLLMLCREPRLYSCQRLKHAAEKIGCTLDILDPNRFLLSLENGGFELFYQQGEIFDKNRPKPEKIANYDGVLARFGTVSTEMGCNVLRHFELQHIPTLNTSTAFTLARNKWQSLQQLLAHGIPVPSSAMYGELVSSRAAVTQIGVPLVIKTLSGSQGVGVMLSESQSSATSVLDTLNAAKMPNLLQRFIPEAVGCDIRAFVLGDEVIAAMIRKGQAGEFRANIHQGGKAENIALSDSEKQLAIKAAKAIGLDVAGVDLIYTPQGLMVLEVNASPGLEGIEGVTQIPIAEKMVDLLCQKIITSGQKR